MSLHNQVLYGDALEIMRGLPAGIVQTCVTSPPYWGLRDYGVEGQLGLESTPEGYVARLVEYLRAVWRLLRDDGTLWIVIGDSYAAARSYQVADSKHRNVGNYMPSEVPPGLKPKDLVGIPWRVAFALQADGWWLRADNIWSKPNPMPESVTDRPTTAHEHVFLLAKSKTYHYDADAIREPHGGDSLARRDRGRSDTHKWAGGGPGGQTIADDLAQCCHPAGRNKRSVWEVATKPYPGAHFATFPPELIEPCILAGSSPQACQHCGAPWQRQVEKSRSFESGSGRSGNLPSGKHGPGLQGGGETKDIRRGPCVHVETIDWQPTCSCEGNDGSGRCVVLDPFAGSGTTGATAYKHGRDFLLIELSEDYAPLITKRLAEAGVPEAAAEAGKPVLF